MRASIGSDDFAYRPSTDDDRWILPEVLHGDRYRFRNLAVMSLLSCRREMYLFDAGAHIGAFSVRLKREIPWLQVHAFEPEISNFHYLRYNLGHLPGVYLHQQAVGETNCTARLLVSEETARHQVSRKGEGRPVEMIDLFAAINRFRHRQSFIILKMDIEGYEHQLLPNLDLGPVDLFILEGHGHFENPTPLVTSQGLTFWFHPFDEPHHGVYVRKYPNFIHRLLR